jgi:hypothetical protein
MSLLCIGQMTLGIHHRNSVDGWARMSTVLMTCPTVDLGRCEDQVMDEPASGRHIDSIRVTGVQGYLTYKKKHLPRTLP